MLSLSLSLSVSLGLSLTLPPALATVPTVSAERPLLLALGASAACGAARGAGALRSDAGHEERGSHLHSENGRTAVTTAIMSLSFKFSDAEALLGRRPGRRPEEPKQGCEAPLRCEVSKQSCGKSQNAAGEPAYTHPPASHVDASHARWRGERQLEAARTRAKRVPVRFPLDGTASSPAGLVGSVYATRTSGDNEPPGGQGPLRANRTSIVLAAENHKIHRKL